MSPIKDWYVVHTRPNSEEIAARHLGRQGFAVFLPRIRKRRRHARKIETVVRPLFARYLFVNIDMAAKRWRSIHGTIGVSTLVCHGDKPAVVPHGVVESLLARSDNESVLAQDSQPAYQCGDSVRLVEGAFANLIGVFERMTDSERVAVLLNVMGRAVRVTLHVDALEPQR